MPITGTLNGSYETVDHHNMIIIGIDNTQYDVLEAQIKCLFDRYNITFDPKFITTPVYILSQYGIEDAGYRRDEDVYPDHNAPIIRRKDGVEPKCIPRPPVKYYVRFRLSKDERLEDFAEFEGKQVEVRYRFRAYHNGRGKSFRLKITGISELRTTEAPPETAATPEPSAEVAAAAAAEEDIALAPVPLVPAPRPPRRMRQNPPK